MYYAETWIDGRLFYKHTPNGEWKEFTSKMYADRIKERELELLNLKYSIQHES